jgi:hypothetical protein
MPRTISASARTALFAQQTGEIFVLLLELDHAELVEPIRVCSDSIDTEHGGRTYQRFPFEIGMPPEDEDAPPIVRLKIANADRAIVAAVRQLAGNAMTVTLTVVLASSPDTIEAGPLEFTLRNVTYDAEFVEGELQFEDVLNEPFPADTFNPNTFPGLF